MVTETKFLLKPRKVPDDITFGSRVWTAVNFLEIVSSWWSGDYIIMSRGVMKLCTRVSTPCCGSWITEVYEHSLDDVI